MVLQTTDFILIACRLTLMEVASFFLPKKKIERTAGIAFTKMPKVYVSNKKIIGRNSIPIRNEP
jgi:hypothetical protein